MGARRSRVPDAPPFPVATAALCLTMMVCYAVAASGWALPSVTGDGAVELGNPLHIVGLGARSTPLVADAGEAWRLVTCHFVHTSELHLVFNLVFLAAVGAAIEQVTPRQDYLAVLVFTGAVSATVSLLGTPQVSAGASGLVFGVMGAAVSLGIRHRPRLGRRVRRYFGFAVLPVVAIVFGIGLHNELVDHASHTGGLLGGLAIGCTLRLRSPRPCVRSTSYPLVAALGALVLLVFVAPLLVRIGKPPLRIHADSGATLEVPGTWVPRYGVLGELEFFTAGGMVVLTTDRVPADAERSPWSWYETHRLRSLTPTGDATAPVVDKVESLRLRGLHALHVRVRLRRYDIPMVRDVYFLRDARRRTPTTVLSFEAPVTWASKYGETRSAVVGSLRPPARPDPAPGSRRDADGAERPPISVAALQ